MRFCWWKILQLSKGFFSYQPNITKILIEYVDDVKCFKSGPSATFFNLAFRMKLIQNLVDEKLLIEHPPYSNRPSLSHRQDQRMIFLHQVDGIKGFRLGLSATFVNLAFKMKLIRNLVDEKLLMENTPIVQVFLFLYILFIYSNRPSASQRHYFQIKILLRVKEIKSLKLGTSALQFFTASHDFNGFFQCELWLVQHFFSILVSHSNGEKITQDGVTLCVNSQVVMRDCSSKRNV